MFNPMRRFGHSRLSRLLALGLAALQFAAYAAAPAADFHGAQTTATAAFETAHTHDCQPLHRADTCALCRLASLRLEPAPAVVLAAAAPETRVTAHPGAQPVPPTRPAPQHGSRAPPTSLV